MPMNLMGLPVACLYRKRRAAARVAVKLGEHDAGNAERVVECVVPRSPRPGRSSRRLTSSISLGLDLVA